MVHTSGAKCAQTLVQRTSRQFAQRLAEHLPQSPLSVQVRKWAHGRATMDGALLKQSSRRLRLISRVTLETLR